MISARVPNRGSPPAVLLRESYREAGKVKNRTLANLSSWPEAKVDALSRVLKGQPPAAAGLDGTFEITRSLPHGHVAAVLAATEADLDIRPIRHRTEDRVRAHVFLRMLSYYITWHMQARLAPMLFTDDDRPAASAARPSPVAPAARSPRAHRPGIALTPSGSSLHLVTACP